MFINEPPDEIVEPEQNEFENPIPDENDDNSENQDGELDADLEDFDYEVQQVQIETNEIARTLEELIL